MGHPKDLLISKQKGLTGLQAHSNYDTANLYEPEFTLVILLASLGNLIVACSKGRCKRMLWNLIDRSTCGDI